MVHAAPYNQEHISFSDFFGLTVSAEVPAYPDEGDSVSVPYLAFEDDGFYVDDAPRWTWRFNGNDFLMWKMRFPNLRRGIV